MATTWTKEDKPITDVNQGQPLANGFFMFLTYGQSGSPWTDLAKAEGHTWTDAPNASGTSYTKIPKPTGVTSTVGATGGIPIGLTLLFTSTSETSVLTGIWTDVANPSSDVWTKIPKAD